MIAVLGYALITALAGGAVIGLVRVPLRLEERVVLGLVLGVILGTYGALGLALLAGLSPPTVLGGPLAVLLVASLASIPAGGPFETWRLSLEEFAARWRRRRPWGSVLLVLAIAGALWLIFAHSLFEQNGDLMAGYSTVWADWSKHLTYTSNFSPGHNLPPQQPLFNGDPLLYPFLPDFHSAGLRVLGAGVPLALAAPSALVCLLACLLVLIIAQRLAGSIVPGVIAVVICILGGGLGFVGAFHDACIHSGRGATRCSAARVVTSPVDGIGTVVATIHDLPTIVMAQPRAYDGVLEPPARQAVNNQQWHTPLTAWWLPQRGYAYGFATALTVLVLVLAACAHSETGWSAFAVAGLATGTLPLVHVHSLIALGLVLPVLIFQHRRREWGILIVVAAVIALPRLLQIAQGPHGTAAAGNQFPYIRAGWLWDADGSYSHVDTLSEGVSRIIRLPFNAGFWEFWLTNLGAAVPLAVVAVMGALAQALRGRLGAAGARLRAPFPAPLLNFCISFMLIFPVANIVIFQSWDWDNTKILSYWYLAVSLLTGALVVHWWRRWWRALAAVALVVSMVLTGVLGLIRMLPSTPVEDSAGPYVLVGRDDRNLAALLTVHTDRDAVFLTPGEPNDPVVILSGRRTVLGYYGWLWSYGTDFGTRVEDVAAIYAGCPGGDAGCPIPVLLDRYHVSYVEVDDRQTTGNIAWWHDQFRYPAIALNSHIVIYDVRRP